MRKKILQKNLRCLIQVLVTIANIFISCRHFLEIFPIQLDALTHVAATFLSMFSKTHPEEFPWESSGQKSWLHHLSPMSHHIGLSSEEGTARCQVVQGLDYKEEDEFSNTFGCQVVINKGRPRGRTLSSCNIQLRLSYGCFQKMCEHSFLSTSW